MTTAEKSHRLFRLERALRAVGKLDLHGRVADLEFMRELVRDALQEGVAGMAARA